MLAEMQVSMCEYVCVHVCFKIILMMFFFILNILDYI